MTTPASPGPMGDDVALVPPETARLHLSAEQCREMVSAGMAILSDLGRWELFERADAEIDRAKRLDRRRRILSEGSTWLDKGASEPEIDALYLYMREAIRLRVARRTAAFRARYGIALSCGDAETAPSPRPGAEQGE